MLRSPRPLVLLILSLAAWMLPCGTSLARLVVMHGHADLTSAILWTQVDRAGPVEVVVEVAGQDGVAERRFALAPGPAPDHVAVLRVPGLQPGKAYPYRVTGDGETRQGVLRTQPWPAQSGDAPDISIAVGSCFFLTQPAPFLRSNGGDYQIFDAIAAKAPDTMLWLGDNVYFQAPDITDPSAMAASYRRARSFAPLQRLLTATSHLAIWDDHDYGPSDGDRNYPFKGETLELFKRYWPNPTFGLPEVPGVFGWVRIFDVEIFMLDDRYYRWPNRYPEVPEKSMFGAGQLQWLKEALMASSARIKIVAGGGQFWNTTNRFEGLHRYPHEQRSLAGWLVEQQIDGVVFVSGDRHFGELLKIDRPGAYPIYEYTSSPLTSTAVPRVDAAEYANRDLVPGTLRSQRQFGMLRITGPARQRVLAFETYDSNGALLWRHEVPASQLSHPAVK